MKRFVPALTVAAAMAFAPAALAAPQGQAPKGPESASAAPQGPPNATVRIVHIGGLKGGKAPVMSTVPVVGSVEPFAPGQRVEVSFYRNGKRIVREQVRLRKGKGNSGFFKASVSIDRAAKYAVSAKHVATPALGADSSVRKSWRVSFPALGPGQCGDVVVGFKRAMRRMGYIANSGPCFGDKTARGVLAYRKVNDMTRSTQAGKSLVKRVFAGRGGYKVRHPGAGKHVEAPLSKQVLVFTDGDKPYAIYPVSSGASSTPTVRGHFRFLRTEPGYNSLGMYYSWYFYGGYAIHGYKSVPNYPASHGCLRTFIADQPEIFERISLGESIFVF